MPVEVRLHPDAQREMRAAFLWYFDRNRLVAESFRAEAEHAIQAIAKDPNRWPELTGSVRRYVFPRFPFTAVYRVKLDCVEVVAIAHQKRRPEYWNER